MNTKAHILLFATILISTSGLSQENGFCDDLEKLIDHCVDGEGIRGEMDESRSGVMPIYSCKNLPHGTESCFSSEGGVFLTMASSLPRAEAVTLFEDCVNNIGSCLSDQWIQELEVGNDDVKIWGVSFTKGGPDIVERRYLDINMHGVTEDNWMVEVVVSGE